MQARPIGYLRVGGDNLLKRDQPDFEKSKSPPNKNEEFQIRNRFFARLRQVWPIQWWLCKESSVRSNITKHASMKNQGR